MVSILLMDEVLIIFKPSRPAYVYTESQKDCRMLMFIIQSGLLQSKVYLRPASYSNLRPPQFSPRGERGDIIHKYIQTPLA